RPCTALVLGGGGARGGAHLGVIRQLEAQHIPIDLIVGTSIGAFVGGLYASGYSPDDIEKILQTLDWGAGFTDKVSRDEMPLRRSQQRDQYAIRLDIGLGSDGVKVPKGLLLGQAMAELIQTAYGVQSANQHFDQLPIPFRAIATNLRNKDTVVLSEGSLMAAVQASMSIPGVVQPMRLNGQILVDGGVANNLPISVARSLGAHRIIAVAIDAPLQDEAQLDSAFAVTEQLTSFLVRQEVEQQKKLLTVNDLLLEPKLAGINTLAFDKMGLAIAAGHKVAVANKAKLASFSRPDVYQKWQVVQRQRLDQESKISKVTLLNQSALADEVLLGRLQITPGETYSANQLTSSIHRLYGLDQFERVRHQLKALPDGSQELVVEADDKSWGPGYLNFNFLMDDDFSSNRRVQLAASYNRTNLSPHGAEWYNEVAIGTDKLFSSELYWPIYNTGTFVSAKAYRTIGTLIIEDNEGLSLGEFIRQENALALRAGVNLSDDAQLTAAWLDKSGRYQLPAFLATSFGEKYIHFTRQGPELKLLWDSLDHPSFPGRGFKLDISRQWLDDEFRGTAASSINNSLELIAATSWQNHRLKGRWLEQSYHSANGDIALEQYSLGGLLNLSGYPRNYLYSSALKFGSLVYLYKMHENRFSFFQSPFYLGGSVERGWVKDSVWQPSNTSRAEWIWAGSLFLGWDSPIGTVLFGYGQAQNIYREQNQQLYLSIGQWY
ncbi:MAG: patatin-like phospholipase family protein, partial [Gammaproteobacteria bacterium]|nr:patatin-like phospholipase family protein [Gammaproteobacteria bacterium]